jgi:hypothetical protein
MALPSDVRKVYDFPFSFQLVLWGYAPEPLRRSLTENVTGLGRKGEAFPHIRRRSRDGTGNRKSKVSVMLQLDIVYQYFALAFHCCLLLC